MECIRKNAVSGRGAPLQHRFTYQMPAVSLYSTEHITFGVFNEPTLSTSN
jgi:hypothetical protein